MPEDIQRRIVGEPKIITESGNGLQHKVQFELGEKNGQAIVVAVETEDSPGRTISNAITRDLHLEFVENPDDEAAVQAAIAKVREQIVHRT